MVVPTVAAAPIADHQHISCQIWSCIYTLQMHMVAHTAAAGLTQLHVQLPGHCVPAIND